MPWLDYLLKQPLPDMSLHQWRRLVLVPGLLMIGTLAAVAWFTVPWLIR